MVRAKYIAGRLLKTMFNSYEIGLFGEKCVRRYLVLHGYRIVTANFKTKFGEIDIIARKGKQIKFVEVKARSNVEKAAPREYVDAEKLSRIRRTADYFMTYYKPNLQPSVCVAEVYLKEHRNRLKAVKIAILENV